MFVSITNTSQTDSSAEITLTPTSDSNGTPIDVSVDMLAGRSDSVSVNNDDGLPRWLSNRVGSDQLVTSASFWADPATQLVRYLPGDFAVFDLLAGRTRQF